MQKTTREINKSIPSPPFNDLSQMYVILKIKMNKAAIMNLFL